MPSRGSGAGRASPGAYQLPILVGDARQIGTTNDGRPIQIPDIVGRSNGHEVQKATSRSERVRRRGRTHRREAHVAGQRRHAHADLVVRHLISWRIRIPLRSDCLRGCKWRRQHHREACRNRAPDLHRPSEGPGRGVQAAGQGMIAIGSRRSSSAQLRTVFCCETLDSISSTPVNNVGLAFTAPRRLLRRRADPAPFGEAPSPSTSPRRRQTDTFPPHRL